MLFVCKRYKLIIRKIRDGFFVIWFHKSYSFRLGKTKITKFEVNIFRYVSHAMEDLLFLPQEYLSLTRIHLFLSSANKIKLESITYVQVTHVASKFCEIKSTDQTEIRLFSEQKVTSRNIHDHCSHNRNSISAAYSYQDTYRNFLLKRWTSTASC